MKHIYWIYIPLIIIAVILTCFNSSTAIKTHSKALITPETIIVDAGHGGFDGGAIKGEIIEKDINLSIAKMLEKVLVFCGYNVIMTRSEDVGTNDVDGSIRMKKVSDIKNRLKLFEETDCKCIISVHQNMFSDSFYSGTQVFYSPNNDESKKYADFVQASVKELIQKNNNRVIKPCGKNIYLMYHTTKPAILVECGFMSNSQELAKLLDEDYQRQLALSIANGIMNMKVE